MYAIRSYYGVRPEFPLAASLKTDGEALLTADHVLDLARRAGLPALAAYERSLAVVLRCDGHQNPQAENVGRFRPSCSYNFV